MAKTLNEAEVKAGVDNAVLAVIDQCGVEIDAAISKGMEAEYTLGWTILAESEKIWLADGEKQTGDKVDKAIAASIKKSRNQIVDGLIESGRFDFGRTKFMDAIRIASKFDAEKFVNLSSEFNRTAIIELASVSDDKQSDAIEAVRDAAKKADTKGVAAPNVRETIRPFKPTARKSSSVPFPLKVADKLAETFDVAFFAALTSDKGLSKAEANSALAKMVEILATNGIDLELAAERARAAAGSQV